MPTWKAAILDLDGVITQTAKLHAEAWKRLFDEYLAQAATTGDHGRPFDPRDDYLQYVDGKPRQDGVHSFLESRGIHLPLGEFTDPPEAQTCHGLGNRKDGYFQEILQRKGPEVFADALEALKSWRARGMKTAVASSSRNCAEILRLGKIESLFDARVDGTHLQEWKMPGKPAPDMFLAAARALGVQPGESLLVEDAIVGIEAGRRGHFGLVVGVARHGNADGLRAAGADQVVEHLTEIPLERQAA